MQQAVPLMRIFSVASFQKSGGGVGLRINLKRLSRQLAYSSYGFLKNLNRTLKYDSKGSWKITLF